MQLSPGSGRRADGRPAGPKPRLRAWAATAIAVALVGTLSACGGSGSATEAPTSPNGVGALGGAPSAAASTEPVATMAATKPAATAKPPAKALTCDKLKNARLGSASVRFEDYADFIPLADGIWSGEDGRNVSLRECGLGDLDGDGAVDGLASVVLNSGGTGQFYYLAAWRNVAGEPAFTAYLALDDRTPVEKITISGGKATVIILTRTPDMPAAALNIRRTAIYQLSGATLVELSHTDAPYTPS